MKLRGIDHSLNEVNMSQSIPVLLSLVMRLAPSPGMHVDGHQAEPFADSPAMALQPEEVDSSDGAHGPQGGRVPFLRPRVGFKGGPWGILTTTGSCS